MAQSPRFWNWMAARYARLPIADEASYQKKLAQTRALLRPEMAVLEFGCGTGTTALHHAPHVARIEAIDFSPAMIAIARDKAAAAGIGNARFEVSTLEDWPAPAGSYDMVLGMSILHLLRDRPAALARVHGLLKPGGLFVSSTACIADMSWKLRLLAPVFRFLRLIPLGSFMAETLLDEMRAAGFVVEDHWRPGRDKAMFVVGRKG